MPIPNESITNILICSGSYGEHEIRPSSDASVRYFRASLHERWSRQLSNWIAERLYDLADLVREASYAIRRTANNIMWG